MAAGFAVSAGPITIALPLPGFGSACVRRFGAGGAAHAFSRSIQDLFGCIWTDPVLWPYAPRSVARCTPWPIQRGPPRCTPCHGQVVDVRAPAGADPGYDARIPAPQQAELL
jgi:hypothetical protein